MNLRRTILIIIAFLYSACSPNWQKVIQYGSLATNEFHETLEFELVSGLIIVPVQFQGKEYRFLFDTGAPQSISDELQQVYNYRIISKGTISDTDNHRTKVNYVAVDTLYIGKIPFVNQTAFVTSFQSNALIKCLKLDGIIGSNLMRYCNWKIDYAEKKLHLSNTIENLIDDHVIKLPFKPNQQFSMKVNFNIGTQTLENLTVDFGSNGSISIPDQVFNTLKENHQLETFTESGIKQSGLFGEAVKLEREITYVNQLTVGDQLVPNVEFRSGGSGLIGEKVLSRFVTTIDWSDKYLYLKPVDIEKDSKETFGFKIGYTADKGVYVKSVIEYSNAALKGIIPDMRILSIDELNFTEDHTICDYVTYMENPPNQILITLLEPTGSTHTVQIKRAVLSR